MVRSGAIRSACIRCEWATVETTYFGTPIGSAHMTSSARSVPIVPPIAITASASPASCSLRASFAANPARLAEDLAAEWAVLGEAVQTVLRKAGHHDAYERLKAATQNREFTEASFGQMLAELDIPEADRARLKAMAPKDYVGPFVAVRPNAKGKSMLEFKGAGDYGEWVYTLQDLKNEIQMQQLALSLPK